MGSFRLTKSNTPHLHGEFKFAEPVLETVGKSDGHSCKSAINRRGTTLPLDPHG